MADRSVDDDDRRRAGRGRHHAVDIELVGADRFEHRNHHRQVFGLASRHHGVGCDLLDRERRQVGRNGRDHFLRIAARTSVHPHHALRRRRNYREAVSQATLEHELEWIFFGAKLNLTRAQGRARRFGGQPLGHSRLDRLRAASGTRGRIGTPVNSWLGSRLRSTCQTRCLGKHALPIGLVEALEAAQLGTALVREHDGRNDLDIVGVRDFEGRIVEHRRRELVLLDHERVARRVLADRDDVELAAKSLRCRLDERHRHPAGRAILLDEAEQRGPRGRK